MSNCVSNYEYEEIRKNRNAWQKLAESRLRLIKKKNRIIKELKTNGK